MLTGPFFERLEPATLADLDRAARRERFLPGQHLFSRGGASTHVYALLSGHIKVSRPMADGSERALTLHGPGDVVGSLAAVQDAAHTLTATAIGDVEAAVWSSAQFRAAIARSPEPAEAALNLVAKRAEQVLDLLEEYASLPLEQRLARMLLRMAGECGKPCGDDAVQFHITRQDLAELTSVTLPTVSRMMSRWRRDSLIGGQRRLVIIRSLTRLTQLADVAPDSTLD